ncbi:hypothetical protein KY337_00820 [Candidatus Woesearchaeota archaeon]|nr:hypothetical protein [Candidatus Woesearchaeota archaeon]
MVFPTMVIPTYGGGRLTGPLSYLDTLGLTDVILPFILVFAVAFAVLRKSKIFKDNQRLDGLVALVMALAVVIPHVMGRYPSPQSDVVNIINTALPNVGAVLIALVMLFVLVGIWGVEGSWGENLHGLVVILSLIVVVYIFGRAAGWFTHGLPRWLYWLSDPDTQALIIIILIFGLIIWFITAPEPKPKGERMLKSFADLFKKVEK